MFKFSLYLHHLVPNMACLYWRFTFIWQAIYLNVVSGFKLTETAGDVAIAAAICSRCAYKFYTLTVILLWFGGLKWVWISVEIYIYIYLIEVILVVFSEVDIHLHIITYRTTAYFKILNYNLMPELSIVLLCVGGDGCMQGKCFVIRNDLYYNALKLKLMPNTVISR